MRPNRAETSPPGRAVLRRIASMFFRHSPRHFRAAAPAAVALPPASRARRAASPASQRISGFPNSSRGRLSGSAPLLP